MDRAGADARDDREHWLAFERVFMRMRPPLRPDADVVAAFRERTRDCSEPMLLLGVTPELADLRASLTAVDRTQAVIDRAWPGDTPRRRAGLGTWLKLDPPSGSFASVIGDGAPTVPHPGTATQLLREAANVLMRGGRFVCRVLGEPLSAVRAAVERGEVKSIHALEWRVAMAIGHERGEADLPPREILDQFERWFPDRGELARETGWPRDEIDTIDMYRGSEASHSFASRSQLLAIVPDAFASARFVEAGRYELAERCPLFVLERA